MLEINAIFLETGLCATVCSTLLFDPCKNRAYLVGCVWPSLVSPTWHLAGVMKKTFVLRQHSWFISFRCRIRCVDMTASLDLSLFTTVDDRFEIFVHFTCVDPVDHICYMKSINIRWFVWISFKFGFANRSILCTIWTNFVMLCIAYVNTGSSLSWFFLMCNFVNS